MFWQCCFCYKNMIAGPLFSLVVLCETGLLAVNIIVHSINYCTQLMKLSLKFNFQLALKNVKLFSTVCIVFKSQNKHLIPVYISSQKKTKTFSRVPSRWNTCKSPTGCSFCHLGYLFTNICFTYTCSVPLQDSSL